MLNVLLWFDTEDYITPESDDALLGLLNLLEDRGLRANFKIVGEKIRALKARNREDILVKLRQHEIGYHTDYHSVPPTLSEYLDAYSFRNGVGIFDQRESTGKMDLEDITGMTCSSFGQAGYSWAPHTFPTLKHWGIDVYLDVHDVVSLDGRPFWYGGMLNLTQLTGTMRMELQQGGLAEAQEHFDRLHESLPADNRFLSIYYHPCEFSTTQFWDGVNFAYGANPRREEWKPARLRPSGEMEHYLGQLGRFLDYTLSKGDVRYIVPSEVIKLEHSLHTPLSKENVKDLAKQVGRSLSFYLLDGHSLSASDVFLCFYEELTGHRFESDMLYGPDGSEESEYEESEIDSVRVGDLVDALQVDYPEIYSFRQLPNAFVVGGKRIRPVDMVCTMAQVIAEDLKPGDFVSVVRGELMSDHHVRDDDFWGPRWVIFPHDLRVPNIVQNAKLQAWTLKPALF